GKGRLSECSRKQSTHPPPLRAGPRRWRRRLSLSLFSRRSLRSAPTRSSTAPRRTRSCAQSLTHWLPPCRRLLPPTGPRAPSSLAAAAMLCSATRARPLEAAAAASQQSAPPSASLLG
ncbi:hypothetical protein TSOC_013430, partial [Tetrabaena socialis]